MASVLDFVTSKGITEIGRPVSTMVATQILDHCYYVTAENQGW